MLHRWAGAGEANKGGLMLPCSQKTGDLAFESRQHCARRLERLIVQNGRILTLIDLKKHKSQCRDSGPIERQLSCCLSAVPLKRSNLINEGWWKRRANEGLIRSLPDQFPIV